MKAFSYRKQSRYTVLVFIYSTLPVHKFPLNLLLLRLWYVPCSAPLSTCTCLSPHMPLCCNYLFVPASYASVFLLCPVLGTQELTLEWERERRGSGREKNWKKKKKATISSKQEVLLRGSYLLQCVKNSPLAGNLGAPASPVEEL